MLEMVGGPGNHTQHTVSTMMQQTARLEATFYSIADVSQEFEGCLSSVASGRTAEPSDVLSRSSPPRAGPRTKGAERESIVIEPTVDL